MKLKFCKKILLPIVAVALLAASACSSDAGKTVWEKYAPWRELNDNWIEEQAALTDDNGQPVYTRVVPAWNSNAYVLMRWFNDPQATEGNLRPLFTSTVDVKYIGRLYNDAPFDSSYTSINPADSIARFQIQSLVPGWAIAMERMHVGDSVEVLIPYAQGYGSQATGDIKPYSALKFNIKLVDVAAEYVRP